MALRATTPGPATLEATASPRLVAYATLGAAGLLAAVLSGRVELAAVGAPFLLLFIVGVVLAVPPELAGTVELASDRVLEGEVVAGHLVLHTADDRHRVEVVLGRPDSIEVLEPAGLGWTEWLTVGEHRLAFTVRPQRWGHHRVGPAWVRVHGPLGLVRWEGGAAPAATLRVLPAGARLRRPLRPHEPRAASGAHVTRRRGDGLEFAELRPFRPGDRLRDVNWRASTRRDQLWVNEHHPERAGDVVLFLDTFADGPHGASEALEQVVRAAWTVADAQLAASDRVGVVAYGGYPAWLAPGAGPRARLRVLDRLLATQATWSEAPRPIDLLVPRAIPPGAVVAALSPFHDERMVGALVALRRRGYDVLALRVAGVTPVDDEGDAGPTLALARRLHALELDHRVAVLDRAGVPVVRWPAGTDPAGPLQALGRLRRRPARRRYR